MEDGEAETERPSRLQLFFAWVIVIAGIALRIWLGFFTDYAEPEPRRPYVPPDPGVSVEEIVAGTCLREPHPAGFVHPVACTDPHRSEIVALLTYAAPAGAPYPRVLDLLQQTLEPCRKAFETYAGATAERTAARFYVVGPLLYEWAGGNRTVICYAESADGTPRTSPLRAR